MRVGQQSWPSTPARLNHIGIAVSNLPELKKLFEILGIQISHSEDVPEQGVKTHFLPLTPDSVGGSHFEFLEVTDPKGTIAQFLAKRGPGIHHLSFSVEDLDSLCQRLRKEGMRLVYDAPRAGAQGMRINFIHPGSAGGILVELMEPASRTR